VLEIPTINEQAVIGIT